MLASDSASRERLELETRVLAAALRQSLELGDMEGSTLAHEQIFILLRACQDMQGLQSFESAAKDGGSDLTVVRGRRIPDIQWFSDDKSDGSSGKAEPVSPGEEAADPTAPGVTASSAPEADKDLATLVEDEAEHFTRKTSDEGNIGASRGIAPASAAEILGEAQGNHSQEAAEGGERGCVGSGVGDTGRAEFENGIGAGAPTGAGANFYDVLQVAVEADAGTIHLRFLVMVRALLRGIKNREEPLRGVERRDTLKQLQDLWIAHDVLSDKATRSDYDARLLGLGDDDVSEETAIVKPPSHVRIGELLQCSGLLEKTELEIAADMHKAMPEIMFGAFLVKQGFVEEHDLECVLLAQQLIKTNDISLSQFQELMQERGDTGASFSDLVLDHKLVSRERVFEAISALPVEELSLVTVSLQLDTPLDAETEAELIAVLQAAEPADQTLVPPPHDGAARQTLEEETGAEWEQTAAFADENVDANASGEAKSRIDMTNAVPHWKDQLDWGAPEEDTAADAGEAAPLVNIQEERNFQVITGEVDALPAHLFDKAAVDEYRSRPAQLPAPEPAADEETDISADGGEEHRNTSERVKKRSLIDLMVDFQTHERVQEPPPAAPPQEEGESSLSAIFQKQGSAGLASLDDTAGDTEFDGFENQAVSDSDAARENAPLLNFAVDGENRQRSSLDEVLFGVADSAHLAELDEFSVVEPLGDNSESAAQSSAAAGSPHFADPAAITGQIDALPPQEDLFGGLPPQEDLFDELPPEEELAEDVSELSSAVDEVLDLPDPETESAGAASGAATHGGRSGSAWEEDTATDVPAVSNAEIKASDKAQKSKDTWSIISKPASYLASFLMDEGVPKPPKSASEQDKKKENRPRDGSDGSDGSDTDARRGFKRKRGR
ncbi:MAG: hypothetical protein HY986_13070 [Candidatus Melainabacteria bacterium]|nr:hypothetical protein [Candidatus Melainabacteria bacterium]